MKFPFVAEEKAHFSVNVLCAVLGVSRSGFYAWRKRSPSARTRQDACLAVEVTALHKRSRGTYGSPRVFRDLVAKGICTSKKRVARLMRSHGLAAKRRRRFKATTDSKHTNPIAPAPARLYRRRSERGVGHGRDVRMDHAGWMYFAAILDLCSRRVVGWATSEHNDRFLALEALRRAVHARKPGRGLIHHSDRGSPYASDDYLAALRVNGMVPSMSRKGDCWDNAVAESFFATLKGDLCDRYAYVTRGAAERSIAEYIEAFYNPQRRHSTLDYVSPMEFELKLQLRKAAA